MTSKTEAQDPEQPAETGASSLSDVIVWLVNLAEQGYVPMWLRDAFEREFVRTDAR